MSANTTAPRSLGDYSLVGEQAALAVQKGLADAKWYASPIPKEKMRELLERRDGPAVRDTLIWFAPAVRLRGGRADALGHRVGDHPVCSTA